MVSPSWSWSRDLVLCRFSGESVPLSSSVPPTAALSEFGELDEVPVDLCHVPAAWMRRRDTV